ncbi:MAG: SAM-dependent methyltransferase [Pseudomonadota bacterium]|nr:SAM-dependent methyltransferase [Pseudomonadota bacterium]
MPPHRSPLPEPGDHALRHSRRVRERIERDIADSGGWISFARYMELALYAPGLGYYSAGAAKFDASGDFITAPELSALFARTLARQFAPLLARTGDMADGDILELGAGSGRMALDLLTELESIGRLPRRYRILEISGDLAGRQRDLLVEHAPHLAERVEWLHTLPESFSGVIVANEVLDALPTHLVVWREAGIDERGVAVEAGEFVWRDQPITGGRLLTAATRLQRRGCMSGNAGGYLSEINLAAGQLVASLANILVKGVVLLIDYGFGESEYYHAQRDRGTLMCHYRHHAHEDPFHLPGLDDMTSHIDFSAIAESGVSAGLRLAGYTTQAQFLINCGITELLETLAAGDPPGYASIARAAHKLLSPAEMGELFKVMALSKNWPEPLSGFTQGDKRRLL